MLGLLPSALNAALIEAVTLLTARPEQHAPVSLDVLLRGEWTSPYRATEVALDLKLTSPGGHKITWPGYHVEGAARDVSTWRVRCALPEPGLYQGEVVLSENGRPAASQPIALKVAASGRRGFLRTAGTWVLRYDNGEPFRGVGQNICWEYRDNDDSRYFRELHQSPRYHYEYMLGKLAASGGNFFRTWMCAWNLPLEWRGTVNTDRYVLSPDGPYNESAARRMDELVALCDSLGLHMMLTLDTAGSFMGGDWELNAYNTRHGGPARNAEEFFSSPSSKERYRDRLRYLVARWGHSPSVAVWEFFNEVDNLMHGVEPRIQDARVVAWHAEMSAFLKEIDPLQRPVTTSISHRDVTGLDDVPTMDINQRHVYGRTTAIPGIIAEHTAAAGKPYVIGEYAYEWDWSKDFNRFSEEMDRDFKRGAWLGLFSPTPILPLSWWWEFFDSRDRTRDLAPVREVMDLMLEGGATDFSALSSKVEGKDIRVLALSAAGRVFLYTWNEGPAKAKARITIEHKTGKGSQWEVLDPDQARWSKLTAAAGPDSLEIELPAHGHLVVVSDRVAHATEKP